MMSDLEQRIEAIITPTVESMDLRLVRVRFSDSHGRTLQVMAERLTDGGLNLDECAELSRTISELLDAEDPIEGEYNLQVSSAGLERPLVREADFERFVGKRAKLTLSLPNADGRKRFTGRLKGFKEGVIRLESDDANPNLPERADVIEIPFADVSSAHLLWEDTKQPKKGGQKKSNKK